MSYSWYQSLVCLCLIHFYNLCFLIKKKYSEFWSLWFFEVFNEKYGYKSLGNEIYNIFVIQIVNLVSGIYENHRVSFQVSNGSNRPG